MNINGTSRRCLNLFCQAKRNGQEYFCLKLQVLIFSLHLFSGNKQLIILMLAPQPLFWSFLCNEGHFRWVKCGCSESQSSPIWDCRCSTGFGLLYKDYCPISGHHHSVTWGFLHPIVCSLNPPLLHGHQSDHSNRHHDFKNA